MLRSIRGRLKNLRRSPHGVEKYDSLLERDYMIELEQDPAVKSWTKEHGVKIPYKMLGFIPRIYLPDFLVEYQDGTKEIHEGKGLNMLLWGSTNAKRSAAEAWCRGKGWKYKVITQGRKIFYTNNYIENLGFDDSR